MNRDSKQLASLSSGAPPQAWEMREGMVMIGKCKYCKKWDSFCPVDCIRIFPPGKDDGHLTSLEFGCILWESNETASS